jgi:hypothetical protein
MTDQRKHSAMPCLRAQVAEGGTEPGASVQAGPGPTLFRGGGKDNRRQQPPRYSLNSPLS